MDTIQISDFTLTYFQIISSKFSFSEIKCLLTSLVIKLVLIIVIDLIPCDRISAD